ncbi:MAG: class I SAM-dependent methyltransferase [Alphaproteobacteria bacterium]|nr:class I SAM-dependent methyltransferase [Alphaproteobacteria bacterium]
MFASALGYAVRHPKRLAAALMTDPASLLDKLHDSIVQWWEYRDPVHWHRPDADWEDQLHAWLECPSDDCFQQEFVSVWSDALSYGRRHGIDVGPASFAGFNDGDAALGRALWCLVRRLRPEHVVETGVAHGFTSRFILEALARNGTGCLHSIDRPPLDPVLRERIGMAVPSQLRNRWELIAGSSRRRLPKLLSRLGSVGLFVHDSLHTERNVRFELDQVWPILRPGGVLVIDDIDSNAGYESFLSTISGYRALVCEAEPARPDERRFNRKGLFAIVLKDRERAR